MNNIIDLFSGVGGLSLGMQYATHNCKTILYCDRDVECRKVLQARMARGQLSQAPIAENVVTLHATPSLLKQQPTMLCAGFPCQDVSVASAEGTTLSERTGLFVNVIRLATELPTVHLMFLENVHNIKNRGLENVIGSVQAAGFSIVHGTFYAFESGLPHKRARWFALCVRNHKSSIRFASHVCKNLRQTTDIRRERQPHRLVPKNSVPHVRMRVRMMGNAAAPPCAAHAFTVLIKQYVNGCKQYPCTSTILLKPMGCQGNNVSDDSGSTVVRKVVDRSRKTRIQLPTGQTFQRWATPTVTFFGQYRLTRRSAMNLVNQLYWEHESHKRYCIDKNIPLSHTHDVNPEWVEWLMGFPRGWTQA
jgi:hypothetical protein